MVEMSKGFRSPDGFKSWLCHLLIALNKLLLYLSTFQISALKKRNNNIYFIR